MKFKFVLILLLVGLNLYSVDCFDCDKNRGCLLKKKLFGYVSAVDTRGDSHKLESNVNYKNVFVFNDKLVFFKASLPQENISEQEILDLNSEMNEAYIERLIPFRNVILECGRFQNRLCHAKELALIAQSETFKTIKSKIANADEKCIAFTFIDKAYSTVSEKIAIMCITDPRQVKDLLSFKNFVSNQIFQYHLAEAGTRYDASSGIEIKNGHYISYVANKPTPVFASIRSKSILLVTDDKKKEFIKSIKLLGLRDTGAYSLRKANELKKLKDGWSDSLQSPPPLDCCIVMPNDDQNDLLCVANTFKKKEIEVKKEKCLGHMSRTLKAIWGGLRKIQFSEKLSKLITDTRLMNNCASPEYGIFKAMILDAGRAAIRIDCKILMQYSPDLFMTKKDYCIKHYSDEMELMIRSLSKTDGRAFWKKLKECTYSSFGIDFSDSFILSIMKKEGIDTEGPKSFLQIREQYGTEFESSLDSESSLENEERMNASLQEEITGGSNNESEEQEQEEKDNIDDDDAVVEEKKPAAKPKIKQQKKIPYVFAEVSSKTLNTETGEQAQAAAASPASPKEAKKEMDIIVYNKPTEKMQPQMIDKIKILRENSMRTLQKNHVWTPAKSERQNESFSKVKYQQGNKNADLFVSFLGYIRDTSYKQSPPLFEKIKKKFTK